MSAKTQHNNILLAILGFLVVVATVAVIGLFAFGKSVEEIQGEVEVTEYRVSSKVPGRILEIRVKEGDYVHVGDTLAILDAPEVEAKMTQAQSVERAASAMSEMAQNGARRHNRYRARTKCGSRQRQDLRLPGKVTSACSGSMTKE